MKKFVVLGICIISTFAMTACGGKLNNEEKGQLKELNASARNLIASTEAGAQVNPPAQNADKLHHHLFNEVVKCSELSLNGATWITLVSFKEESANCPIHIALENPADKALNLEVKLVTDDAKKLNDVRELKMNDSSRKHLLAAYSLGWGHLINQSTLEDDVKKLNGKNQFTIELQSEKFKKVTVKMTEIKDSELKVEYKFPKFEAELKIETSLDGKKNSKLKLELNGEEIKDKNEAAAYLNLIFHPVAVDAMLK